MKHKILKSLAVCLAVLALLCVVPSFSAFADNSSTYAGFTYKQKGKEAVITGYKGSLKEITIPEKIGNLTVTEIAEDAFNTSSYDVINLPHTIRKIGKDAFYNCYVKTVNIKDIASWCKIEFENEYANPCASVYANMCIDGVEIKSLYIPDGVSEIKSFSFYGNTGIEKVFIPQSVKSIGEMAFRGAYYIDDVYCVSTGKEWEAMTSKAPAFITDDADIWLINPDETPIHGLKYREENGEIIITGYEGNLYKLEIPEKINGKPVTKIDSYALERNEKLAEVILPDTVNEIYYGAFFECKYLTKVNIPEGIDFIHEETFRDCHSLLGITIPSTVKEISYFAFNGCQSFTKLQVPEGTENVADHAFSDCYNLKGIFLPDSLTQLAGTAFYNTAYYNDESNWQSGVLYIGDYLIDADENIKGEYSINPNTKIIGDYAFYNCKNLTEITIPNTLVAIGNYGFYGCEGLSYLYIPEDVQYIGYDAFESCYKLKNIDFGGSELSWTATVGENNIGADRITVNFDKEIQYILGDVTLDGRLNIRDATAIQKHMAKIELLEGKALEMADFNSDGKLNIKDATAIQKHIAGIK